MVLDDEAKLRRLEQAYKDPRRSQRIFNRMDTPLSITPRVLTPNAERSLYTLVDSAVKCERD